MKKSILLVFLALLGLSDYASSQERNTASNYYKLNIHKSVSPKYSALADSLRRTFPNSIPGAIKMIEHEIKIHPNTVRSHQRFDDGTITYDYVWTRAELRRDTAWEDYSWEISVDYVLGDTVAVEGIGAIGNEYTFNDAGADGFLKVSENDWVRDNAVAETGDENLQPFVYCKSNMTTETLYYTTLRELWIAMEIERIAIHDKP